MRSMATSFALVFAITVTGASNARAHTPISKVEARSWPASQVKRRVLDQLSEILSEERLTQTRPPKNLLTDMSFTAEPRATSVPNLCQIDRLTITFQPGDDERGDAHTPVSANGFSSTRFFHFKRPPSHNYDKIVDYEKSPNDASCRTAKLWDDEFFTAPDDRAATDGYLLAHQVMDAIVAGNPSFVVACDLYPVEAKRTCADIVSEIKSGKILSIDRCETDLPEFKSTVCFRVFIGDRSLRIIATEYAYGPDIPPPLTVKRVELDSLIVMVHERVD